MRRPDKTSRDSREISNAALAIPAERPFQAIFKTVFQARTIRARGSVSPRVALRVSTTNAACSTIQDQS